MDYEYEYEYENENLNRRNRNNKKKQKRGELFSWVVTILSALVIAFLIKSFIFNATTVEGTSMYPNLHNGDKLISNRVTLFFNDHERGDVIVFATPVAKGDDYIKRVLGVPGETIDLVDGHFYIDGKFYEETYLPADTYTLNNVGSHWELGSDQYFVVGDNRTPGGSNDSRSFGPIDKSAIKGITSWRYFPFDDRFGRIE